MRPQSRQHRSKAPGFASAPGLLLLWFVLLQLSCSSTPEAPEDPQKPRRFLIGVVKGVRGKDFVIFKRSSSWMPAPGSSLQWRPRNGDGKGGTLERSPERRGALFVADIVSGVPEVEDLVYFHEVPGAPDAATQTIGTPDSSAPGEPSAGLESAPLTDEMENLDFPANLPALRPPPEDRPDSTFSPPARSTTGTTDAPASQPQQSPEKPPAGPASAPPGGPELPPLRPPPD